jgi:nitrogen regulatory protein P-II 1
MRLITAIIRPERLPEVKAALFRAGVTGMTLSRVSGHGGEREIIQRYRADTVVMEFHEKVRIDMASRGQATSRVALPGRPARLGRPCSPSHSSGRS